MYVGRWAGTKGPHMGRRMGVVGLGQGFGIIS